MQRAPPRSIILMLNAEVPCWTRFMARSRPESPAPMIATLQFLHPTSLRLRAEGAIRSGLPAGGRKRDNLPRRHGSVERLLKSTHILLKSNHGAKLICNQ
jgi:hypothetical protein